MQKSERIKSEVSLRQIAESAGVKWDLRKSQPRKGDWWAPCPFHHEKTSSFHIVEPSGHGGFFKCFGCHKGGTVIDFVMEAQGLDFTAAVRLLAEDAGIAGALSEEREREMARKREKQKAEAEAEAERLALYGHNAARNLWRHSRHAEPGDLLARYLTARGVRLAAIGGTPATLRLHMALPHKDGGRLLHSGPAMVGAIGRDKLIGVHRTWITDTARARYPDGKKVSKQWLGKTGHMMGRPVVLSRPSHAVVVGEGIETSLAAFAALVSAGRLGWSAEAALSRGAITGPAQEDAQLWTPRPEVEEVLILGEGSQKHPREARELYEGAAARLRGLGLTVKLTVPNGRWDQDADFADLAVQEFLEG